MQPLKIRMHNAGLSDIIDELDYCQHVRTYSKQFRLLFELYQLQCLKYYFVYI